MALRSQVLAPCLALALLAGCASLPPPPASTLPARPLPTGIDDQTIPAFRLRPGDVVLVHIQTEPAREPLELTLDAQGLVHVPGSGSVALAELTMAEAEARLTAHAQQLDRLARAQIQVVDTPGQRATVLGAVQRQGSVPVTPGMRVAQLVTDSGGELTTETGGARGPVSLADLDNAVLTRAGQVLPISLARAMEGDPRHNVYVQAGDHLFIPPRAEGEVTVFGQVTAPGMFVHTPGLRMTEALAMAGGFTTGADKSDVRLLRGPVEAPKVYRADVTQVIDGEGPDVALQAGDIVFVTDDPVEDAREVFGLLAPLAGFASSILLTTLLIAAQ